MPAQYRVIWSTPGGGTGYSVLHFTLAGTQGAADQIALDTAAFYGDLVSQLPNDVSLSFDTEVLDLDPAGTLVAVWAVTPPAPLVGLNNSTFTRAAGAVINWSTGEIVAGRRLSGKTYIVPMASNTFTDTGILTTVSRDLLTTAAEDFITATSANRPLRVWSRTHSVDHTAESAQVPEQGAVLRGRRD